MGKRDQNGKCDCCLTGDWVVSGSSEMNVVNIAWMCKCLQHPKHAKMMYRSGTRLYTRRAIASYYRTCCLTFLRCRVLIMLVPKPPVSAWHTGYSFAICHNYISFSWSLSVISPPRYSHNSYISFFWFLSILYLLLSTLTTTFPFPGLSLFYISSSVLSQLNFLLLLHFSLRYTSSSILPQLHLLLLVSLSYIFSHVLSQLLHFLLPVSLYVIPPPPYSHYISFSFSSSPSVISPPYSHNSISF